MSTVYIKRLKNKNDLKEVGLAAKELLKKFDEKNEFLRSSKIPIKVTFGEKGNKTFLPPESYDGIIDYIQNKNIDTSFIETNVLYRGSRTTKRNHLKLAESHGFTRIPIIIADGDIGQEYSNVDIDKNFFASCKIAKGFENFEQFIVVSHYKGHHRAGFGGAVKQLAMGFASRQGKMEQHTDFTPIIKKEKCTSCGICSKECDFNAIEIDEYAKINSEKCVGCAGCITYCPTKAIRNSWKGTNFLEKISEYAYGAQLNKKNVYINFLVNITEHCDCKGRKLPIIMDDIGVLISDDPVAIDLASLDVLQFYYGEPIFEKGREMINYCNLIGFGSLDYDLLEIGVEDKHKFKKEIHEKIGVLINKDISAKINKMTTRLIISGKVQAVGYLKWFKKRALDLNLDGWVRNFSDGKVEAVLSGDKESISKLLMESLEGPKNAEVSKVLIKKRTKEVSEGFKIRKEK